MDAERKDEASQCLVSFSVLTLLVGRHEGHLVTKTSATHPQSFFARASGRRKHERELANPGRTANGH